MVQRKKPDYKAQIGFIGRRGELNRIESLIDPKTRIAALRILMITGAGGNGKTRLLHEIDERHRTNPALRILKILDFDDPILQLGENINTRIAEALGREHFEEYLNKLTDYRKIETLDVSSDQLQTLKPPLRKSFIDSFNRVSSLRQVVLRFDTTDALKEKTEALQTFLKIGIHLKNAMIVIAGRDAEKIETLLKKDLEKPLEKPKIETIHLPPLSEVDSRTYLKLKQKYLAVPKLGTELEEKLLLLSGGKPILLDLAMEWRARGIELNWVIETSPEALAELSGKERSERIEEFEKELVDPIINTTLKIHWIFLLMAWVYPLDCSVLKALRDISEADAGEILQNAQTHVFVKQLPDQRFKLHDEMQRMIETHVWPEVDGDGELRREYSGKALEYFKPAIRILEKDIAALKQGIKAADKPKSTYQKVSRSAEREEKKQKLWVFREQLLKHALHIDLKTGIDLFEELYEAASVDAYITLRPQLIEVVQERKDDLSFQQAALLDYYRADGLFSQKGAYDSAREIIEALLEKKNLSLELQIKCIKLRGNIKIRQGHRTEALEDFIRAKEMSEGEGLTELYIISTNALGWAYKELQDSVQASKYYQEARRRYHRANDQIQELLKTDYGLILNNMSVVLSANDRTRKSAINISNSAILHWKQIENKLGLGKGYLAQGICYHQTDHSEQTLEAFRKALEIFEPLGLNEWIAQVLSWRGVQYHNIGRNDEAKADLERALDIGAENIRAMTLNRLGRVYMVFGELDRAQQRLEESLEIAKEIPDFKYWLVSISRLVIVAAKKGYANKLDHFTDQLEDCLNRIEKIDQNALGIAYLGLAELAFLQNTKNNINRIVELLKKGIPNVVQYGSWARRDILKRLGVIEEDFPMIDVDIIREVGRRMIDFIFEKEQEETNYGAALDIMSKWKNWNKDKGISHERNKADFEPSTDACKENALTTT